MKYGMPTLIELPELRESAALCRRLGLRFIELNMSFPQNQLDRLEKVERKKRTHLLCFKAAHIEYIFPIIKDASKTDFIQFCDGLKNVPGVKEFAKKFKPKPIEEVIK